MWCWEINNCKKVAQRSKGVVVSGDEIKNWIALPSERFENNHQEKLVAKISIQAAEAFINSGFECIVLDNVWTPSSLEYFMTIYLVKK